MQALAQPRHVLKPISMEDSQYNEEDRWSGKMVTNNFAPGVTGWRQSSSGLSETSQSPDPGTLPTLLSVPPNIRAIRDQVFCINEDITLSAEQFNQYWGYMDNFWILNSNRSIKDGKQTLNYWCRLWKEQVEKSQGFMQRSKRIRTVEVCGMKLNKYKTWKGDQLVCVTLSRNETNLGEKILFVKSTIILWNTLILIRLNLK